MSKNSAPAVQAKVRLYQAASGKSTLLGFAELVVADSFVIKDIRIVQGKEAPFISFPQRKGTGEREKEYFDIVHPITSEAYQAAREAIVAEYNRAGGRAMGL